MKKIAIITLFYHNYNYGGVLQAYALQKEIEKLGYNCDVISMDRQTMKMFVPEAKNKNNSYKNNFITFLTSLKNRIKNKLNSLLCINELQKKIKKFDSFIEKNIRKTDIVYSYTVSDLRVAVISEKTLRQSYNCRSHMSWGMPNIILYG